MGLGAVEVVTVAGLELLESSVELVSDGYGKGGGGEAGEDAGSFRADGKDWIGEDGAEGGQQVGVGKALELGHGGNPDGWLGRL